jgi:hypothetical protein
MLRPVLSPTLYFFSMASHFKPRFLSLHNSSLASVVRCTMAGWLVLYTHEKKNAAEQQQQQPHAQQQQQQQMSPLFV